MSRITVCSVSFGTTVVPSSARRGCRDQSARPSGSRGYQPGAEIIRITGELFQQQCREQDIVARFGGGEFVVVFWDPEGPRVPGSKHPERALRVLEGFKEALRSQRFPKLGEEGEGTLTISGGLATYPWDGATRETLLKQADEALLAAKRAGKNRISLIGEDTKAS